MAPKGAECGSQDLHTDSGHHVSPASRAVRRHHVRTVPCAGGWGGQGFF